MSPAILSNACAPHCNQVEKESRMEQTLRPQTNVESKSRNWLVILNYLFYIVVALAIVWFIYYMYSFKTQLVLYLPLLLQATGTTIAISVVGMVLAVIFGFIGALGRRSRFRVIRWITTVYVELVRGTPILVQLLLWAFGVSTVLSQIGFDPYSFAFQLLTPLQSNSLVPDDFKGLFYGIIGLSFAYGGYLTEVFRTGIESVQKGQTEAALSLGLNTRQTMRRIILPQAIRITIPPFTNYFITLVQDSSLLSLLSVVELEQQTGSFAFTQTNPDIKMFVFVFGALFYLAVCYPLSLLSRYLEARMAVAY
jgi:polar amino acid transport system permease protein